MHEATIAQSILKIVTGRLAQTPHTDAALRVHVIIGEFRNVDAESLSFAFDNLKGLYPGCSSCSLEADSVKAKAYCSTSNHLYHPDPELAFRCSECGGGIGNLICGEELDVVSVTLQSTSHEENNRYARVV